MQGLQLKNVERGKNRDFGYGDQITVTAEFLCPRCGTFSEARGIAAPGLPQIAYVCRRCHGITLIETKDMEHHTDITEYYPKARLAVDASVPQALAEDYVEAQRCFSVGAWRGCAVMARRFVQSVMHDKGATGRDVWAEIKDLEEKRLLAPSLAEASQHVRVLGKYGAHPFEVSKTGLEEMGMADAQAALDFCEMLIQYLYVLESRLNASRAAPEMKGKATPGNTDG